MAGSDVLLQIGTVTASVGTAQLFIFLLKRRSEISALDRTSSKPLLEEQGAFIDRLAKAEEKANARVALLQNEIRELNSKFADDLERVVSQNRRLTREVSSLRTDVDVANLQLEGLRSRLKVKPEELLPPDSG